MNRRERLGGFEPGCGFVVFFIEAGRKLGEAAQGGPGTAAGAWRGLRIAFGDASTTVTFGKNVEKRVEDR